MPRFVIKVITDPILSMHHQPDAKWRAVKLVPPLTSWNDAFSHIFAMEEVIKIDEKAWMYIDISSLKKKFLLKGIVQLKFKEAVFQAWCYERMVKINSKQILNRISFKGLFII